MNVKYTVKPTSRFRKDYKLMEKRRFDISLLDEIIVKLAQGIPLPASNRDHALTGNYAGHRECHITPDWLLVYRKSDDGGLLLILVRAASHSDLDF